MEMLGEKKKKMRGGGQDGREGASLANADAIRTQKKEGKKLRIAWEVVCRGTAQVTGANRVAKGIDSMWVSGGSSGN